MIIIVPSKNVSQVNATLKSSNQIIGVATHTRIHSESRDRMEQVSTSKIWCDDDD